MYIETYGCWLNRGESDIVRRVVEEAGGRVVGSLGEADVVVVNTCAVRGETERRMLRRIEKLEGLRRRMGFRLVVAGCLVNVRPHTIASISPSASLVEPDAVEDIGAALFGDGRAIILRRYERRCELLPRYRGGVTYVVPIETGCLGRCGFCVEWVARGAGVRSYRPELIAEYVGEAVRRGAREVYLTGQDVAAYGRDLGTGLPELIRMILEEVDRDYRLRIGMMEPSLARGFAEELAEAMRDERIYRYLHLPAQSGDDRVLRLMNRRYTAAEYVGLVELFRRRLGRISVATDIIVGYPGETEQAYRNSLRLIEEVRFDKVHVARYTLRPFTKAYREPQVPEWVKKRRSREMSQLALRVAHEANRRYVGERLHALVTSPGTRPGTYIARTREYKPVLLEEPLELGEEVEVEIVGATPIYLRGRTAG